VNHAILDLLSRPICVPLDMILVVIIAVGGGILVGERLAKWQNRRDRRS